MNGRIDWWSLASSYSGNSELYKSIGINASLQTMNSGWEFHTLTASLISRQRIFSVLECQCGLGGARDPSRPPSAPGARVQAPSLRAIDASIERRHRFVERRRCRTVRLPLLLGDSAV